MSFTSLRGCITNFLYFDSDCSRRMIVDRSALINYKECGREYVTFTDGIKRRQVGKGTLNVEGFSLLENFLHIEYLKAKLLSISQICDQIKF